MQLNQLVIPAEPVSKFLHFFVISAKLRNFCKETACCTFRCKEMTCCKTFEKGNLELNGLVN
jgi:hypothetical protein